MSAAWSMTEPAAVQAPTVATELALSEQVQVRSVATDRRIVRTAAAARRMEIVAGAITSAGRPNAGPRVGPTPIAARTSHTAARTTRGLRSFATPIRVRDAAPDFIKRWLLGSLG